MDLVGESTTPPSQDITRLLQFQHETFGSEALTLFHPTGTHDVPRESIAGTSRSGQSGHDLSAPTMFNTFMRLLSHTAWERFPDALKEAAISAIGDYVEARLAATSAPTPILPTEQLRWLVDAVFSGLTATGPFLRQTAANVAGVLAAERRITGGTVSTELMEALWAAIEKAGGRSEDVAAKEAAVMALVRVLKTRIDLSLAAMSSVSPQQLITSADSQILLQCIPVIISALPIRQDWEDMQTIYNYICELIEDNSAILFERAPEDPSLHQLADALLTTLQAGVFSRAVERAAETRAEEGAKKLLTLQGRVAGALRICAEKGLVSVWLRRRYQLW